MAGALGNPVFLVYLALTVVPGLALGWAFGLRGWLLAATAPLLTYGLVGAAGPTLPLLGVLWSPVTFAITAAAGTLITFGARFGFRRRWGAGPPATALPPWAPAHHLGIGLAVLVAAGIGMGVAYGATRGFTAVPQVWDSVFHANATRYIAATGRSDPAALQNLNNPVATSYYYPNAYHVLAATAVMITGSAVPAVLDTSVALFTALLSIGMAALVRRTGGRPALAAGAALLCCAFTSFPYDLLPWGTLLPFIMSIALLPAFLALGASVLDGTTSGPVATPVALGLGGIGLLALHPSGAVAAALLAATLVGQRLLERGPRWSDVAAVGITAAGALGLGTPLLLASAAAAAGPPFDWPATTRPAAALGELLFLSHEQLYPQYWLVALGLLGLLRPAPLRPLLWFVAPAALFAALFVMAASYEGPLVALLTRPWWNDKWRFAALFTLSAVVLAAAGLVAARDAVWAVLRRVVPRLESAPPARLAASASVLVTLAVVVAVLSDGLYQHRNETRMAAGFTDGPTVSAAEQAAFAELGRLVPPGSMVMNDPYDGSALMWALNDVRPVFASPVIAPQELPAMDPNRRVLFESFNQLDTDVAVQHAVDSLDIHYVILGRGLIGPAREHAPGMQELDRVSAMRRVYENSDASIYRIDRTRLIGNG
jgi:hypothetical protein